MLEIIEHFFGNLFAGHQTTAVCTAAFGVGLGVHAIFDVAMYGVFYTLGYKRRGRCGHSHTINPTPDCDAPKERAAHPHW